MVNFLPTYNRMFSSTVFLVKLTFQPMAQYSFKDSFSSLNLFKSSNCPLKVTPV